MVGSRSCALCFVDDAAPLTSIDLAYRPPV